MVQWCVTAQYISCVPRFCSLEGYGAHVYVVFPTSTKKSRSNNLPTTLKTRFDDSFHDK
jgi:hypothetical protein